MLKAGKDGQDFSSHLIVLENRQLIFILSLGGPPLCHDCSCVMYTDGWGALVDYVAGGKEMGEGWLVLVAGQLSEVGGDTNERNRKNNTTADALTS